MKQPLALRIDADLPATARERARQDGRTPADVIETVLRRRVGGMAGHDPEPRAAVERGREA